MGRKHKERPLPSNVSPIVPRINWLLRQIWGGNIASMASDLHVSHAALSRVVHGQAPSTKMLEALAVRAGINTYWLMTGSGEALIQRGPGTVGTLCPIAARVVPGDPRDYPEMVGPVCLPVASPFAIDAAYWYQVKAGDAIIRNKQDQVAVGDHLLIETVARWTRRSELYAGRIVALRTPDGSAILGRVGTDELHYEAAETQYEISTFGAFPEARLFPRVSRDASSARPPETLTGSPDLLHFFADDVVGVCLLLARLFGQRV